jgi:hypothetical protein
MLENVERIVVHMFKQHVVPVTLNPARFITPRHSCP